MSRMRIEAKVRTNPDYKAAIRYLDQIGLRYEVCAHPGKGHPFLRITLPDGDDMAFTIASSPRGRVNTDAVVARLRRAIRLAQGGEK